MDETPAYLRCDVAKLYYTLPTALGPSGNHAKPHLLNNNAGASLSAGDRLPKRMAGDNECSGPTAAHAEKQPRLCPEYVAGHMV